MSSHGDAWNPGTAVNLDRSMPAPSSRRTATAARRSVQLRRSAYRSVACGVDVCVRRHSNDRRERGTTGAKELCVPEAEDPAIGGHQPVAATVRRLRHAHDGLVEVDAAGGPL